MSLVDHTLFMSGSLALVYIQEGSLGDLEHSTEVDWLALHLKFGSVYF